MPDTKTNITVQLTGTDGNIFNIVGKPFHDEKAMEAMGKWLSGTEDYYLQNFVDSGDLVGTGVSGFTKEEMEALRDAVLPHIPSTRIRGI